MGDWAGDPRTGWAARAFRDSQATVRLKERCPFCRAKKRDLLAHAAAKHPDVTVSEFRNALAKRKKRY